MLCRWPAILAGTLIFGAIGAAIGIALTKPTYSISISLIKRRVPQTVQTSENGQAYRPVDLNDATLLATLLASEPLDTAIKRSRNNLDPSSARLLIEASQLEGTDIFYLTYHSPISPSDAISFSNIWAEEINTYTKRLQQTEAHEVRLILQKEVAELEKQIQEVNLEILNFSRDKGYLGGQTQVAAALGQLSQIELQLDAARTTAAAKEQQLKNYNAQIQRQSPLELQLKVVREELANLRATYTDANPLVQAKLQSIEYLEGQIGKLKDKGEADLEAYTGTPLGNQLYLSILGLRNEYLEASSQIQSLEELYRTTSKRLSDFPSIISTYEAMQEKRRTITEGLSLMSNRLKEAEIFASGAPGYWQVFQAPDARRIVAGSKLKKPAILGVAGAVFGGVVSMMITLLLTQRSTRRSVLECCAATRAPLFASIPSSSEEETADALHELWITQLAPRAGRLARILVWSAPIDAEAERKFWSLLSLAALEDTGKPIQILDLTPGSLWADQPPPDTLRWHAHPQPQEPTEQFSATFHRADSLPQGSARLELADVEFWVSIVTADKTSLNKAASLRSVSEAYLPPCSGTIACTDLAPGAIRQVGDMLSTFLARKFSRIS